MPIFLVLSHSARALGDGQAILQAAAQIRQTQAIRSVCTGKSLATPDQMIWKILVLVTPELDSRTFCSLCEIV